jgi:hypothetical protein
MKNFGNCKITICELICRQIDNNSVVNLQSIQGIQNITSSPDGPFQRLTVHLLPDTDIKKDIIRIIGEINIESMVMRDPTLEEAYLSIIK